MKIIRENVPEFEIVGAFSNGAQCLEFLDTASADLIITDIRMPYMDGVQLIQVLRERGSTIDFILISGYDDFEYCRVAIRSRVFDYILKPLDKKDFIHTLQRYLRAGNSRQTDADEPEKDLEADRDKKIIREIKQYLRTHYRENISLESLSAQFYMNPNYISQLFKNEVGITLTAHLNQIRMEMARHFLRDSQKRVNDVAALVGYQNAQNFSVAFKKAYGMTPREFREHPDPENHIRKEK